MKSSTEKTRRYALSWLIFLKELNVAGTCQVARKNLLSSLTHETYISQEFSSYFHGLNVNRPIQITETDPTPIAALKKLFNAILKVEKGMRQIEGIDIKHDRFTIGIYMDAIENSYGIINELYEAVELINDSTPEIQAIVSPSVQALLPKIVKMATKANEWAPKNVAESTGKFFADTMNTLPEKADNQHNGIANLSRLIFNLPLHFNELTDILNSNISVITSSTLPSSTIEELKTHNEKQQALLKKIKDAEKQFKKMSHSSLFSLIPNWLSTINILLAQTSDLMNSAAPLTKQAYNVATSKLNKIRHEYIPSMLIELETLEESVGLKPGTLTEPALKQMNEYYTQLATTVSHLAMAAEIIDNTANEMDNRMVKWVRTHVAKDTNSIDVGNKFEAVYGIEQLQDYDFMQTIRDAQVRRLRKNESKESPFSGSEVDAASRFFEKLSEYNSWWYVGNMARLPISDRELLLKDYKVFQSHFASIDPKIDRLIMESLTSRLEPSQWHIAESLNLVQRVPELYELWYTNHFSTVLSHRNSFINNLKTTIANTKKSNVDTEFKTRLVTQTIAHRDEQAKYYTVYKNTPTDTNDAQPEDAVDHHNEKQTLFGQVSALKLSDAISNFMNVEFNTFLTTHVEPKIVKKLENPPFTEFHKDSSQVLIYKRAINALESMKNCLKKLESMHDRGNPEFTHRRVRYLIELNNALFIDFDTAKKELMHIAKTPELGAIINQALDIIAPLKSIPIVGDMIQAAPALVESTTPQANMIEAWKAQQAIVQRHVHGVTELSESPKEVKTVISTDNDITLVPEKTNAEQSILLKIATFLYQMPETIEQLDPRQIIPRREVIDDETKERLLIEEYEAAGRTELLKARAEELVKIVNEYSYWRPGFLQNFIKAFERINTQLLIIGGNSRRVIYESLNLLRAELGDELLAFADTTEFKLGLIPGVLATSLHEKLDDFYESVVANISVKNEQDRLTLLLTTQQTENRITREQAHLNDLIANKTHEEVEKTLFFNELPMLDNLFARTTSLNDGYLDERSTPKELDEELSSIIQKLLPHYKNQYLQLSKVDAKFTKEYLSTPREAGEILILIKAMQKVALTTEGVFVKLERLKAKAAKDPDFFNHPENQTQFLHYYGEIEPYLTRISKYHNRGYVLLELQTADDFQDKLDEFITLKDKLMELVAGEKESYQQRIERSNNRITYLENELNREKALHSEKLAAYKDGLFSDYLNNTIKNRFKASMGDHYASVFMQKMELNYNASKSVLLQEINLNHNIEDTIHTKLDELDQTIRKFNKKLISAYEALYKTKTTIEELYKAEQSMVQNPLRLQKIDALKRVLTDLDINPFEVEQVNQQNTQAKKALNSINIFDKLLHIHTELEAMEQCIEDNPDADSAINSAKLKNIYLLKQRLISSDNPNQRASDVKETICSTEFKETMFKNSDYLLTKLFKKILEYVFGWKSQEKQTYLNLEKQTFLNLDSQFSNRKIDMVDIEEQQDQPFRPRG